MEFTAHKCSSEKGKGCGMMVCKEGIFPRELQLY